MDVADAHSLDCTQLNREQSDTVFGCVQVNQEVKSGAGFVGGNEANAKKVNEYREVGASQVSGGALQCAFRESESREIESPSKNQNGAACIGVTIQHPMCLVFVTF